MHHSVVECKLALCAEYDSTRIAGLTGLYIVNSPSMSEQFKQEAETGATIITVEIFQTNMDSSRVVQEFGLIVGFEVA